MTSPRAVSVKSTFPAQMATQSALALHKTSTREQQTTVALNPWYCDSLDASNYGVLRVWKNVLNLLSKSVIFSRANKGLRGTLN